MSSLNIPGSVENGKAELFGVKIPGLDLQNSQSNEEKISMIQLFFRGKELTEAQGVLYMQIFSLQGDTLGMFQNPGKYSFWDYLQINFPDFTSFLLMKSPSEIIRSQVVQDVNKNLSSQKN